MLRLVLNTIQSTEESTLGALYLDGAFQCFTLEDRVRTTGVKAYGKTAIPAGTYEIGLRKGSPMAKRYDKRYICHDGMLWLRDVNDFKWVYIHTGNSANDTKGCILVGNSAKKTLQGSVLRESRKAYQDLYPRVCEAVESGLRVVIKINR